MRKRVVFRRTVIIATVVACLITLAPLQPNNIVFASTPVSLKLPWRSGESWRYNQGPHGRGNGRACENLPRSALDLAPPAGSNREVLASASGKVIVRRIDNTNETCSGTYLIIEHLPGFYTFYGHLASTNVIEDNLVLQGQVIGIAGDTGYCADSIHLHFEFLSSASPQTPKSIDGETISGKLVTFSGCDASGYSDGTIGPYNTIDNVWVPSDNTQPHVCPIAPGAGTSRYWLFQEAYLRNGGYANLGCPTGPAHWWGIEGDSRRLVIQDFEGSAGFGSAAIIHDELRDSPAGTVPAFVVHGGIWQKYISLGGWESWLGAPTSDEYTNAQGYAQASFKGGYITWKNGGETHEWFAGTESWATYYYNNMAFKSGPTYVRGESDAQNSWGSGSPGSGKLGVFSDQFSMRQTRSIYFSAGCYQFTTVTDDGVRLYLYYGGSQKRTLINQWHDGGNQTYSAKIYLSASYHTVQLEYYENGGDAYANLTWKTSTGCQ